MGRFRSITSYKLGLKALKGEFSGVTVTYHVFSASSTSSFISIQKQRTFKTEKLLNQLYQ